MLTPEQRAEHIAALRALPAQLTALVDGWTDAQLDLRPAPTEWCARQVIHHVADSHMNAYMRMKLALSEVEPTIKPYNQEAWAEMGDSTQLPVRWSLALLEGLHTRWVYLWERLAPEDFARTFRHPEHGRLITLDELLPMYSQHGRDHIDQIQRIAREQGG